MERRPQVVALALQAQVPRPLVAPRLEHTIGLVTSTLIDRTPVIAELMDLL